MDNLVKRIASGKGGTVYLIKGSVDTKENLRKTIEDYIGRTASLPASILENTGPDSDGNDPFWREIDLVDTRILGADFLIVHVYKLDYLNGARIKEVVSDDFFKAFYCYIGAGYGKIETRWRKLIIVSDADFEKSIFRTEKALEARCHFL